MNIKKLSMHVVSMPLKQPFYTHLETVVNREVILVEAEDEQGNTGWGEASAFSTPWYTEETVQTEWHIIKKLLFPLLKKNPIRHPEEASTLFSSVRGNRMAKAGVEASLWDLFAKQQNKPLYQMIGGTKKTIPVGAAAAGKTTEDMLERISFLKKKGYKRIKVKVGKGFDHDVLLAIRRQYPDLMLMGDANSSYTQDDLNHLKKLDDFHLMMIEQPFSVEDLWDHAKLQKEIRTPVCLDESIRSLHDVRCAAEMNACQVINVKYSRVGGMSEAIRIHDFCYSNKIDVWAGGMIEFGISRAHTMALASMPGFTLPGDIVSSDYYWEEDVINPGITVENGMIHLSELPGIGYEVNRNRVEKIRTDYYFQ